MVWSDDSNAFEMASQAGQLGDEHAMARNTHATRTQHTRGGWETEKSRGHGSKQL